MATHKDSDTTHKDSDTTHKDSDTKHGKEHEAHGSKPAAGKKGVTQEEVGSGKEHDPNNFARDPERASAAGKKGGHSSH